MHAVFLSGYKASINRLHAINCLIVLLLIFPSTSHAGLTNGMDADMVLGQPDFTSTTANNGGRGANTFSSPRGITTDAKRLFVADRDNQRVLIWNTIPISNRVPADVVLGQPDFASATANNGGRSAKTLNNPDDVATDGIRLYICDTTNRRILIFNKIPTENFAAADVAVGQTNFTSAGTGLSQSQFNTNRGVYSDGKRLFVADAANNRVLIWNSIPTSNGAPADVVVGQPNFTSNTANNGGIGPKTLSLSACANSINMFSDSKKLFVTDCGNSRVLIWNSIPTTNFAPADVVVGQSDFQSSTGSLDGTLNPTRGITDGRMLILADSGNGRVLIWRKVPTVNGAKPDFVLGKKDFADANFVVSRNTFSGPRGTAVDGKHLFVAENHRVLIFNIGESGVKLGPQFEQGKAVLGKVFHDPNGNGIQDGREKGLEGIKVVSDTGIYAITDEDGKYHFPYIETGQRILKIDPSTLPEGAQITTESPRKVGVTEGILTKVSFGVKLPENTVMAGEVPATNLGGPLLKVSISQDPALLKPRLSVSAERKYDKIIFTIDCNYFLFIQKAELTLYDHALKKIETRTLPSPLPYQCSVDVKDISSVGVITYQLSAFDKDGKEDRTSMGSIRIG